MTSDQIREAFLAYFERQGHTRTTSSSLIPVGDPTLLLTTAGMVQFKPYFAGQAKPPSPRLTTAQKCFRTVDIDEVGDDTHLTMFEMLGNFSFGDYFKREAIGFALEFVVREMGLSAERCTITIHQDDDESFELWRGAGIPPEAIHRFGTDHNWWGPAGAEGACGPNTEIHYDMGADRGCRRPDCGPNCTNAAAGARRACDRFVEVWNLVFMQYYHHPDGRRTPLPAPGVDTGMGLERIATVMQGVDSIYDTDLFAPLVRRAEELTGHVYGSNRDDDYAMRVLADHGRGATFLIADGVVPGNEGRGYVLRRVIRRAIRHGRRLGLDGPFLGEFATAVAGLMGDVYPELRNHAAFVKTVLRTEEERFLQAFHTGTEVLEDALRTMQDELRPLTSLSEDSVLVIRALAPQWTSLSGDLVFRLWDTYGFPVEMTREIAREHGLDVDLEGFEREMQAQRKRARAAARFGGDQPKVRVYESLGVGATRFTGYERLTDASVVVGLLSRGAAVDRAGEGDEVEVVLVETPFYAEGGGQVGDAGQLVGPAGTVSVRDTQAALPGLIVHFGTVAAGSVSLGDRVEASVDSTRREDTARNHTATHLLHAALRQVLGPHVRQAGSLVAPDRLRFDFTHVSALSEQELRDVQSLVNGWVRQNVRVIKTDDSYTSAIRRGALAFFGEKYGDRVRLVEVAGGETLSFEVCGGTHIGHTGELGAVYVVGESGIGSGMRRLEAVTGRGAEGLVRQRFALLGTLAHALQVPEGELEARIQRLTQENADLRREREALERRASLEAAAILLSHRQTVDGVTVLASRAPAPNVDALRQMGDWLRDKLGSGVVVLGSVFDGRPVLVAMVTADLVGAGLSAEDIARGAAKVMQGGGGGRPDVAQAGGKRADKLDEALAMVPSLVREMGTRH